jgi:hypothetical protein
VRQENHVVCLGAGWGSVPWYTRLQFSVREQAWNADVPDASTGLRALRRCGCTASW